MTLIARTGSLLAIVAVAALAAACASEADLSDVGRPEPTVTPPGAREASTSTTTTEATEGIPDAAGSYFEALASEDLSRLGAMLDNSAEGSPAALYATHHIAELRAVGSSMGSTVDVSDGSISLSTVTGYGNNRAEITQTVRYSDFTVEGGKLTGFSVDGVPVADRIRAGDPAGAAAQGVTARLVSAYHTPRGDLILNVDVTNGRAGVVDVADSQWVLITPDNRQVAMSARFCCPLAPSIEPGATAGHVVTFEQVGLGGTLRFVAFTDDFITLIRFDVPVPA